MEDIKSVFKECTTKKDIIRFLFILSETYPDRISEINFEASKSFLDNGYSEEAFRLRMIYLEGKNVEENKIFLEKMATLNSLLESISENINKQCAICELNMSENAKKFK